MIELMLIAHRPRSTPPPSPSSPGSAADEGGGCSGVEAMSTMRQRAGSASGAPSVCRGRFDEGLPSAGWMVWRISESGREIPCEASPTCKMPWWRAVAASGSASGEREEGPAPSPPEARAVGGTGGGSMLPTPPLAADSPPGVAAVAMGAAPQASRSEASSLNCCAVCRRPIELERVLNCTVVSTRPTLLDCSSRFSLSSILLIRPAVRWSASDCTLPIWLIWRTSEMR
mmetsp:Transcript_6090/g.19472  ORF Transcript_6090/g.19472 Transcript_6090/m.19472 type:complete len:229 (+) Transcript_6090:194-880(+)